MFESFVHNLLPKGVNDFDIKNLHNLAEEKIKIPEAKTVSFNTIDDLILNIRNNIKGNVFLENVYWKPKIRNFEGIDAAIGIEDKIYLFQMTVSLEHSTKTNNLKKIVDNFKCKKIYLCFVVPEDKFVDFKKQSYLNTDGKVTKKELSIIQCVLKVKLVVENKYNQQVSEILVLFCRIF